MLGAVGLALVIQGQTATLETDPGVVVSKLLAKYYNAATLSGTIVQEVSDGGGKRRITTRVAYIRPGYVFVEQDVRGTNGLNLKLVSDDAKFMYSPPLKTNVRVRPNEMLYEPRVIKRLDNSSLTLVVGDMYHAAHLSLMPNTILDLAIAYGQHMKDFATINVANITLAGMVSYNGQQAYKVTGLWQPYRPINEPTATGSFEFLVSRQFDALRFSTSETYVVNGKQTKLTIIETADLKVDAEVDRSLFKVPPPSIGVNPTGPQPSRA